MRSPASAGRWRRRGTLFIAERGVLRRIRTDNGPESRACLDWSVEQQIELLHIRRGKPIKKALVDSFNGRLREV
jgi:hypothetical protein